MTELSDRPVIDPCRPIVDLHDLMHGGNVAVRRYRVLEAELRVASIHHRKDIDPAPAVLSRISLKKLAILSVSFCVLAPLVGPGLLLGSGCFASDDKVPAVPVIPSGPPSEPGDG